MNADGNNLHPLTRDPHLDRYPIVSPDSNYLVYLSNRGGAYDIWRKRIEEDDTTLKQLTFSRGETISHPQCTNDWVFYHSYESGKATLWKVPIDGPIDGVKHKPVTDKESNKESKFPVISPDGKSIACYYRDEQANSKWEVAIIPASGGPYRLVDFRTETGPPKPPEPIRWTPDGRALAYLESRDGVSNVWIQPLVGGQPEQLTHFESDQIFSFDYSRDGKKMAFLRGTEIKDVFLFKFKD